MLFMDERITIDPAADHSIRFNVGQDRLREANEKIKTLSKVRKEEQGVEVEIIGDKLFHKRTDEDYDKIWAKFLSDEAAEFGETMNYGREDIERIGYKKFIDASDWKKEEDTAKWKTDAANVVICRHCNNEFAHVDIRGRLGLFALCNTCHPLYNTDMLIEFASNLSQTDTDYSEFKDPGLSFQAAIIDVMARFLEDAEWRKKFLF
jgi:hypothetical protein